MQKMHILEYRMTGRGDAHTARARGTRSHHKESWAFGHAHSPPSLSPLALTTSVHGEHRKTGNGRPRKHRPVSAIQTVTLEPLGILPTSTYTEFAGYSNSKTIRYSVLESNMHHCLCCHSVWQPSTASRPRLMHPPPPPPLPQRRTFRADGRQQRPASAPGIGVR